MQQTAFENNVANMVGLKLAIPALTAMFNVSICIGHIMVTVKGFDCTFVTSSAAAIVLLANTSLTWSNNASYPEFTECFQNTALVWVPSGFLILTVPFYLPYLITANFHNLPLSWLNLSKLCIALLQIIICVLEFTYEAAELNRTSESYWKAYFTAPILEALTLCIVVLYLELEKRRGFITSGVLFLYWTLANISYIIPFYSKIVNKEYNEDRLKFSLFNIYFALTLCQLVLACITEKLPIPPGEPECPETRASFLSRISYHWCNGTLVKGYKKPLTETDLFLLNPRDQTKTVLKPFERNWLLQALKVQKLRLSKDPLTVKVDAAALNASQESTERTPLLGPSTSRSTPAGTFKGSEGSPKEKEDKELKISLFRVLLKTFGWQFVFANIWKLFYDLLVFANPLLLQQLIIFAESQDVPSWKGYVLAGSFFLVGWIQSTCFHQMMFMSTSLGVRIRASLIAAIFKKSLRMNNRARTESTVGEIVNLMSVDAEHLRDVVQYIWGVWSSPLQIILALVLLYNTVGYSVFAGLGVMVLITPINGLVITRIQSLQVQQMECKDERIKLITEILNGIKILKLYAWELAFGDKVSEIRRRELKVLRKGQIIGAGISFTWTITPFMVGLATFATYIFTNKEHRIDASTAFVAITLFNILRFALIVAPWTILEAVKSQVSIKRISKFLNHDDLDLSHISHSPAGHAVEIKDGTFSWDPALGPCLKDVNLVVPKGSLVAVVGTVGSGKSSLMSAMLGEMETQKGHVNIDGTTAYVPQQAWIQNATLKDNILYGNPLEANKYSDIVDACALRSDLDILPAKDMTEIGEKGINLSGGQRQRVSLARAVYFNSDIYLMDDPLSAVDSHVGKHIFDKVIGKNGVLKDKTRILVTHGIHWLQFVDRIVVMSNGVISEIGSYDELLAHDGAFAKFLQEYFISVDDESDGEEDEEEKELKRAVLERLKSVHSEEGTDSEGLGAKLQRLISVTSDGTASDGEKKQGRKSRKSESKDFPESKKKKEEEKDLEDKAKLIEEEELEGGHVKWSVFMSFARAVGYKYSVLIMIIYGCYQGCAVGANLWLTDWTSDPKLQDLNALPANSTERRDKNDYYLGIYGVLGVGQAILVLSYACTSIIRMVRAAKVLHHNMMVNILRCPMSFFDTTPVGRIVNRFSQDIDAIDSKLPRQVEDFLDCLFNVLSTLFVITYSTPIFLAILVPVGIIYVVIQRFYIPASRQLRRLESKTRSPIYNNFSESLTGASVIRAFCRQDYFIGLSEQRVDHNQVFAFTNYALNRWLGYRLELLGSVIVCSAAVFSVAERNNISSSLVGLSISYALQITDTLNWLVRMVSEIETNVVSVERVRQYTTNQTEAALKTGHAPSVGWPDQGCVNLNEYSVRYREGLDLVLKNVSIKVRQGEKIGIVGRTGAGKSSLALSIFRLIEAAGGQIVIDKERISELGLHDLRANLTILPQEPVLFSGSLRMNLDPLDERMDDELWTALEHAHLKSFVEGLPSRLEYEVGEGGQNLSVGQRQLVCLARSLLRKSKILVLDEATAAVDLETDSLIQDTITTQFSDCTVLTIAHRLNTVLDYDRILVLGNGEVKEFDSPQRLLQDTDSMFYSMAKDAGLV